MKPHIFHPEADEEYVQAVQYYADIALELGHRFHDEIGHLIREVCAQPKRFWQFDPPARRHLSGDFPLCCHLSGKAGRHLDRGGGARQTATGLLARKTGLIFIP